MHLQQIKEATGKSWAVLSDACGVPKSNLIVIARGDRGWDNETAAKLRLLGVDLNEQTALLARKRGWPLPTRLSA